MRVLLDVLCTLFDVLPKSSDSAKIRNGSTYLANHLSANDYYAKGERVTELRLMQPTGPALNKRVFEGLMPRIKRFKADLKRANVDYINAKGQRADFHALRYTLATNLALAGTPPRVAMEIMRHSDMRPTSKTYIDARLLPVWDNLANLPSFSDPLVKDSQTDSQDSQIDSQNSVRKSPSLSIPVKEVTKLCGMEATDIEEPTSSLSVPVTTSQKSGKWSGRQDSNLPLP